MSYRTIIPLPFLCAALFLIGCSTDVSPTNPFDPEAPQSVQESAAVTGIVQLEGRSDHSGIDIRLDGFSAAPVQSAADGSFTLSGLKAGVTYMVVAEYNREAGVNFEVARLALETALRPGETRTLPTTLLARAPEPPVMLDARKTGDDAITLYWRQNEESDISHYEIYVRHGNSGPFTLSETDCSPWTADADGIIQCEITGLISYVQYSFKVAAVDTSNLRSPFSTEDIFQFLFADPAEVFPLEEDLESAAARPTGFFPGHNEGEAYVFTRTSDGVPTIWKINSETGETIHCATLNIADEEATLSLSVGAELEPPLTGNFAYVEPDRPAVEISSEGSMLWVPYRVIYLAEGSRTISGVASFNLDGPWPERNEDDPCGAGSWKLTHLSAQPSDTSQTNRLTLSADSRVITASPAEDGTYYYAYEVVDGRPANPVLLLQNQSMTPDRILHRDNRLLALSSSNNELLIQDSSLDREVLITTTGDPEFMTHIGETDYTLILGQDSSTLAVVNVERAEEVYRLPASESQPMFAAVLETPDTPGVDAVVYISHRDVRTLSMYTFHLPASEDVRAGHKYLVPLQCYSLCRMETGTKPEGLIINSDGSAVLNLDTQRSNRIYRFNQPLPTLEEQ